MTINKSYSCFKAYDIRGKLDVEINEEIVFQIGYATAKNLQANKVVVGYDARESSPKLSNSAIEGIRAYGADVLDIGLAGTEQVYQAVSNFSADAGIVITASHNPINYNGMKIIKQGSQPLTNDDFADIKALVEKNNFKKLKCPGQVQDFQTEAKAAYINKILSFINLKSLKPLKIVLNSGNGAAGPVVDELENYLTNKGVRSDLIRIHHEPDPSFPNGIPNPLLEENRASTSEAVKKASADFGVAFDGDFDRCFFFDNLGNFISSEYIVGLIVQVFLRRNPGSTIVHDLRIIWNIIDLIERLSGKAQVSRTGHTFVKHTMREVNAIYGSEISGHHYFRDFAYCDSGMIPWLLVWELLSTEDKTLSDLLIHRKARFKSSGEINFMVTNAENCIYAIKDKYNISANDLNSLDGISLSFDDWRFNIRKSNTESLIRLNIETKGDLRLLNEKKQELKNFIRTL